MSEGNVGTAAWQINTDKKLHCQVKRLLSVIKFPSLFNPKGDKRGILKIIIIIILYICPFSFHLLPDRELKIFLEGM